MQKNLKPAEKLARIVEDFSKVTITVLGDLVADEFIYGEIARVSREAPVLILRHRDRTIVPGGAGLADLGVNVLPVGVIGDDEPGRLLLRAFRQKRVSVSGIRRVKGRNTVTKTRILAGTTHSPRQQVVRVDHEPESPLDHAATQELIFQTRGYVRASDALLISDYGYGSATPEIFNSIRARASLDGIPITLDSRYRTLAFTGVTAATPNEAELEEVLRIKIGTDNARLLDAGKANTSTHEIAIAACDPWTRRHGRLSARTKAGRDPDPWFRRSCRRYRRGRYRDRHLYGGAGHRR